MKTDLVAGIEEQRVVEMWTVLEKQSLWEQLTSSQLRLLQSGGVEIDSLKYRSGQKRHTEKMEDFGRLFANKFLNIIILVSVFSCECHPISLLLSFRRCGFHAFQMNEELAVKINEIDKQ